MRFLWGLAERADWYERRPMWFWRWLLRTLDRKHGYHGYGTYRDYGED